MDEIQTESLLYEGGELTPEEIAEAVGFVAKFLPPEEILSMFGPEERLAGLDPEDIEAYLQKLSKKHGSRAD
ncbi:hypothetical protein QUF80_16600 [Desulfococcaceae bacterium HSG8]|nr:hypothetical protein [Desulfococcaceae bacterium HSG8]